MALSFIHRLYTLSSSRADIYQPGVILTTVCATSALLATIFFVVTLVWPKRATGSLKIQAWIFTFFSLWLFATQIPYTVAVATHRAKIDAFLDGLQLPAQTVQAALAAAGESDKYSKLHPGTPYSVVRRVSQDFDFFLSCPSCHFPLDFAGLPYRPYRHSLHGCPKTRSIGNAFSATRFRKTGRSLSTKYSDAPTPPPPLLSLCPEHHSIGDACAPLDSFSCNITPELHSLSTPLCLLVQ